LTVVGSAGRRRAGLTELGPSEPPQRMTGGPADADSVMAPIVRMKMHAAWRPGRVCRWIMDSILRQAGGGYNRHAAVTPAPGTGQRQMVSSNAHHNPFPSLTARGSISA